MNGLMRKQCVDEKIHWEESLPRVLRMYHDLPGESGLSPFQIVFGRDRNVAGVPYQPEAECESTQNFFDRMEQLDLRIAEILRKQHGQVEARENAKRRTPKPYRLADKVWVIRQRGAGISKLDTWWTGPAEITRRVGALSYEVMFRPGLKREVHHDQLKPFVPIGPEELEGPWVEFQYSPPLYREMETAPDEGRVESILRHRQKADGTLEFLVKWEGWDASEATWETPDHFITQFCD